MAPASLWLPNCTQAAILLGCVAVCCQAFLRCIMARLLLPLSSLALLSSTFFCCHALHIAFGVLVSLQCWLRKLLVLLPMLCIGPHSARMRVAACRRAPHAARHVSENWPLALQPSCLLLLPRAALLSSYLTAPPPLPCFFSCCVAVVGPAAGRTARAYLGALIRPTNHRGEEPPRP